MENILICPEKPSNTLVDMIESAKKSCSFKEFYENYENLDFKNKRILFAVELGDYRFAAHGEGEIFSEPHGVAKVKLPGSGKLMALSYCNIHGLWGNEQEISMK